MNARLRDSLTALIALSASCASSEPAPPAPIAERPAPAPALIAPTPGPSPQPLAAETPLTMSSGARLSGAKGWLLTRWPEMFVLQDPERELTIAVLSRAEPDADAAIAGAWRRHSPAFSRKVERRISPPAREGWDEMVQVDYQVPAEESRVVFAVARRKHRDWYVTLLDGRKGAFDRRTAEVTATIGSLRIPGAMEETLSTHPAAALDAGRLKIFEAFLEEARVRSGVPGAAISIVQGGKVVLEKGFGVRQLGAKKPVTPDTVFLIGSATNALTTFMMAKLVDEGRLTWDTPVSQLLPRFSLADPALGLTVKNTVCACAGVPRREMLPVFEYAAVTPEKAVEAMGAIKPTTGFGEKFQESDALVATGGYAAARAVEPKGTLGAAYDKVMQSRVFDPLAMRSTTFDFDRAARGDHAAPHARDLQGEYVAMPPSDERGLIPCRPAAGAWSSARDLSRYVAIELGRGERDGKRVVSEANLLARREPQIEVSERERRGLGLSVEDDHGVKVVRRGGSTLGFSSDLYFLPDHDLGVVVLANSGSAELFLRAVRRRLVEIVFDAREKAGEELSIGLEQERAAVRQAVEATALEPDPGWLAKLAGSYASPVLGAVTVRVKGKDAVLDAGEWRSKIGQVRAKDGTSKLVLTGVPFAGLELLTEPRAEHLALVLDHAEERYVFEPAP